MVLKHTYSVNKNPTSCVGKELTKEFFSRDTRTVAKDLLGCYLSKEDCVGKIVETEAYKDDEASHARKLTPRSRVMYESYGKVYVYRVYGMYYCLNFTCEKNKPGAVLIRAVEPIYGVDEMKKRRSRRELRVKDLANGPGKLCEAFGINKYDNNKNIGYKIKIFSGKKPKKIVKTSRIGISKSKELLWRYYIKDNEFVSKPF